MSRKRTYDDPLNATGLGTSPGVPINGVPQAYYEDSYSDSPGAKRPMPPNLGYSSTEAYGQSSRAAADSWNSGYDPYSYLPHQSGGMEYERYDSSRVPGTSGRPGSYNSYGIGKHKLTCEQPLPSLPTQVNSKFGLGLDRYGYEQPGVLMKEFQETVDEMKEEIAFLKRHPEVSKRIPHAIRVLEKEAFKLENCVEPEWLEVDINKPINLTRRILIPTYRHPSFNFVGKIIGNKGQTLASLGKAFKTHILLLGEGSCRDNKKEAQLFNSGNPRYLHYGLPLHIQVSTIARPHIAFERLAGLLNCIHKLLMPSHDLHVSGITDGNVWFESGETLVYDPPIFDEAADEEKEAEFKNFCAGMAVASSRGRGRGRGRGTFPVSSTSKGNKDDDYVVCYDDAMNSDYTPEDRPMDISSPNGSEFKVAMNGISSRGARGRGRGRGAVPIRRG